MNWPTSQDYNEAIQDAASCFSDPALKSGEAAVNAVGLPVPRSGSFADVYQFKGGDGKTWALKCFTRKVAGLQERYTKIDEHIGRANFPFTVGFKYLAEGIRVHGQWFPLLKMEWVEGYTLNDFVCANAGKPQYLHALMQMWAKLTGRLRDGNFAHADLQHGNVLMVPGNSQSKLGLKLIDYDGMWVPSLAEYHSGEVGHPNFQHPLRLKDRLYNADVDRFPHLVIASALRATLLGGQPLWDQFDNEDNLLFKEADLRDPGNAPVFKTLWNMKDDVLCVLVGKMALASKEPLRKTPWLDDLLLTKDGERLTDDEEKSVMQLLGVGPHFTAVKAAAVRAAQTAPAADEFSDFEVVEDEDELKTVSRRVEKPKRRPAKPERRPKKTSLLPYLIGGGVLAVVLIGAAIAMMAGGRNSSTPSREMAGNDGKTEDPNRNRVAKVDEPPPPKERPRGLPVEAKKGPPLEAKNDPPLEAKKDPPLEVKKGPNDVKTLVDLEEKWKVSVRPGKLTLCQAAGRIVVANSGLLDIYNSTNGAVAGSVGFGLVSFRGCTINRDGSCLVHQITKTRTQVLECRTVLPSVRRFAIVDNQALFAPVTIAAKAKQVLLPQRDGGYGVYSLTDGKKLDTVALPNNASVAALSCTDDGTAVLARAPNHLIYFRPTEAAPFKMLAKLDFDGAIAPTLRLSPSAKHYLQFSDSANTIQLYETATGGKHALLTGHGAPIRDAFFHPNGRLVFSIADTTLRIWDVETGKEIKQVALNGEAQGLDISADGLTAATISGIPSSLRLWRVASDAPTAVATGPKTPKEPPAVSSAVPEIKQVWSISGTAVRDGLAFSSDGRQIIAAPVNSGEIRLLDPKDGSLNKSFKASNVPIMSIADCPDDLLVVCDKLSQLALWDLKTHALLSPFTVIPGSPYAVSVAADTGKVWVANQAGIIGLVNLKDGKSLVRYPIATTHVIVHLAVTANGRSAVAINAVGDVFTKTPTSANFKAVGTLLNGTNLALSPDGKLLVVAGARSYLRLFDMETGEEQRAFEGHTGDVVAAAFSRNGKYLLSIGADKTFRLWNTETGKQVQEIKLDGGGLSLAISPDGKAAATSTANSNSIQLWRLPAELAP